MPLGAFAKTSCGFMGNNIKETFLTLHQILINIGKTEPRNLYASKKRDIKSSNFHKRLIFHQCNKPAIYIANGYYFQLFRDSFTFLRHKSRYIEPQYNHTQFKFFSKKFWHAILINYTRKWKQNGDLAFQASIQTVFDLYNAWISIKT